MVKVSHLGRALDRAGYALVLLARASCISLLAGPILLLIWLSFGAASFLTIPPSAYSLKWYVNIFSQPELVSGFWISLEVAAIVTPLSMIIGTLAALGIHNSRLQGVGLLQAAFYAPLTVPYVVTGIALLYTLTRIGMYDYFWNIVVGHVIITFPYTIRTVLVSLARYDLSLNEAGASLGASPIDVFWRITLPLIRPGLFAGGLFAFVMSFDDFTVTIFLIGPATQTLPVAIYHDLEWNTDPTICALSTLLVVFAVLIMLGIERLVGLERLVGARG